MGRRDSLPRIQAAATRIGVVLFGVAVALALEHCVLGVALGKYFVDADDLSPARTEAAPIFLAAAVPAACVISGLYALAERRSRRLLAAIGAAAAFAFALGVTQGRHFGALSLRAPVVAAIAVAGAVAGHVLPRAIRMRGASTLLAVGALAAWCGDAFLLRRTYPAVHLALFASSLAACGFSAAIEERRLARGWLAGWALGIFSLLRAPSCARAMHQHEHLRVTLVEHAPWTGRAVRLAMAIVPPEPILPAAPAEDVGAPPVARALDWSGRDVLLITVDALRADHLGAYGYARATSPHLDALAREGTIFLHAYCPIPHTSHSLVSLMTGKFIHPLLLSGLGADSETLALQTGRLGYQTAAFYPPAVWYVDTERFEGFYERSLDFAFHVEAFADPIARADEVRSYLSTAAPDQPTFVWVHFFEPHEPYERHADHDFGDEEIDLYDGEIAATDDGIDEVVRAMREARPNAVVIVTADHGEEFDDHGGQFHGTTTYEEQVRVPLVVVGPGVEAGRELMLASQTVDLFPTIVAALGGPRSSTVRGRDLGAVLSGSIIDERGIAWVEADEYEMVAEGPYRLVCERSSAGCGLFDVTTDPLEQTDVGAKHRGEVKRLRSRLAYLGREQGRFEQTDASTPTD